MPLQKKRNNDNEAVTETKCNDSFGLFSIYRELSKLIKVIVVRDQNKNTTCSRHEHLLWLAQVPLAADTSTTCHHISTK